MDPQNRRAPVNDDPSPAFHAPGLESVDKRGGSICQQVDGLSLVGGNAHTDREFAVVDSMVPRFYLLTRMVMELGKGPKEP